MCEWLFSLWLAVFSDNSEQMLILADHHQKLIHRRSLRYPDRIPHNVLKVCWQWKKKFYSIPRRSSDLIGNGLTNWNLVFCKNFFVIFYTKLVFSGFSQIWLQNILITTNQGLVLEFEIRRLKARTDFIYWWTFLLVSRTVTMGWTKRWV